MVAAIVSAGSATLCRRLAVTQQRAAVAALVQRPSSRPGRGRLQICSGIDPNYERSLVGENFGARDPFAAEIESNFGEKVLGNYNTEHMIKPPERLGDIVGLKNKKCVACEGGNVEAVPEGQANQLLMQCPGWKIRTNAAGANCLAYEWKVRNFTSGLELFKRLSVIAEEEGHHPDLHLTGFNNALAELTTHSAGGLTVNDFIMAAKINELNLSDLMPTRKIKYWA